MRPEVSAAPIDTALLDAHLAGWDYTDAYDVMVDGDGPESALAAIRCLSGPAPARLLLRARDLAVSTVGLKPAATGSAELFPALLDTPQLAVIGLDDAHLDFRIIMALDRLRVRCITAVRRHNALGCAYFAVVRPFHRRLVPYLLTQHSGNGRPSLAPKESAPQAPTAEPFGSHTVADPSWGELRSRTITWYDPIQVAAAGLSMSGLKLLQAVRDGLVPPPPISQRFQMGINAVEPGRVEFTCQPDESAYNPIGVVHGGLVCAMLDTVVGCAVHTTLPVGSGHTSIEIKVSYLRPVHGTSGPLVANGKVVKPGRRVAFAEGSVSDAAGKLVATATSTLLVFSTARPST